VQLQWGPLLSVLLSCCYSERKRVRRANTKRGAFSPLSPVIPSTRDYPEDLDRLEVRVPTVGKPSKSEHSDEEVHNFSSEDFHRNCEVVKLFVVLQQYSTFTTATSYTATRNPGTSSALSKLQFRQYIPESSRQQHSQY
jgi:hypothetical protein